MHDIIKPKDDDINVTSLCTQHNNIILMTSSCTQHNDIILMATLTGVKYGDIKFQLTGHSAGKK